MKKYCFLFLLFVPSLGFGVYSVRAKHISLYWGQSYRLNQDFYSLFDVSFENFRSNCTSASFKGYGIRLDHFNKDNYALSVRYFKSLVHRPDLLMTPYWGISPVAFSMMESFGLNLKPELGLRFNSAPFSRHSTLSVSLNIAYGYDIPILSENQFLPNRHDFSAKLALSINIYNIQRYLKHKYSNTKDSTKSKMLFR
ncbi:MAG: hypothetical protein IT245_00745 [Bacteroidia bacterium]|nr:hypothetical protein [Bacteroidia bacterium]